MLSKTLRASLFASVVAAAAPSFASSISTAEGLASGTAVTIGDPGNSDPNNIVTAILSAKGTTNGFTYSNWAILTNDGTGSINMFGALGGYIPNVGDDLTMAGTYSPFHQIPELATTATSAFTVQSSFNSVPAITTATIPQLNLNPMPLGAPPVGGGGSAVGEYLFNLNNVTITSGTSVLTPGEPWGNQKAGGAANLTLTITDSSSNSMTLFYWPSSYSSDAAFYGQSIPQGVPTNMTGFVSIFTPFGGGTPSIEFTPISVTALPEPAAIGALALGSLGLLSRRRRA